RRIFANPSTVTGSIGVYYGKADASALLRRLGVNVEVYKTTPRADAYAFYRPYTPAERAAFQERLGEFYELFLQRVASGRNMSKERAASVAEGKVWTGRQGAEVGLVDELGGLRQAILYARRLGGLPEYAPILELPEKQTSLLGKLLGIDGVRAADGEILPAELLEIAQEIGRAHV